MFKATRLSVVCALAIAAGAAQPAAAADHTFSAGSLIIPMDLSYQSTGMFQAYGLVYQLLRQGVHVHWVIDPNKTWHAAPCNSSADPCAWDCDIAGSGTKCAYPTASPDFTATVKWVWDDTKKAARDAALGAHAYRGGPFVIDAADHAKALAIIDIWNDPARWAANPWAQRSVTGIVVTVHEATADFTGNSAREMIANPTIAVFADGNETIATGYLRAAGIPQSNGTEFPNAKCGTSNCGPGSINPDMLTEEAIMGDMGTCSAPNLDHHNGALFKADGTPAFCQIMSMHWNVAERETVKCNGTTCPTMQSGCTGQTITYNGHEVVAEVREFLKYATHFFAECQAVNAYENTVPNPNWPFLDDMGRDGHFLTTTGTPPACAANNPCTNSSYTCTQSDLYCGAGNSCCLPNKATWIDMPGYEVAAQPASSDVKVLHPDIPYNQFDGAFGTTGGSEPAYNLSSYLPTTYKNNRQVTLLTGLNGPGSQDLWMTGYLDGCGDIILKPGQKAAGCEGKISYLGGHQYSTNVPVTSGSQSQGTRLFLNALFEAQCTTANGGGGGGGAGGDTDGDGVPDSSDPYPDDPNKCGDNDSDGCDDCSSGQYDPSNDCAVDGGGGDKSGCCDTGGADGRQLVVAGLVGLLMLRPRRRRA
jgi:hypothetical protein